MSKVVHRERLPDYIENFCELQMTMSHVVIRITGEMGHYLLTYLTEILIK